MISSSLYPQQKMTDVQRDWLQLVGAFGKQNNSFQQLELLLSIAIKRGTRFHFTSHPFTKEGNLSPRNEVK